MKIQIDVDLNVPRWVRNVAMVLAPAAFLVTATVVRADVPNTFKDGDTLSAQKLNDDFAALDTRIKALETSPAVPSGTIIAFGGEVAPDGWLPCDGTQLDGTNAKYAALYAAIGTAYGGNTTSQTFNLPDLRGKFLRGWDHGAGADPDAAMRTAVNGGGHTGDHVGTAQAGELASHTHSVSDPGHAHTYTNGFQNDGQVVTGHIQGGSNTSFTVWAGTFGTVSAKTGITLSSIGGAETRPVNVAVNYIIKL
jgi:microcystin-dependent protein